MICQWNALTCLETKLESRESPVANQAAPGHSVEWTGLVGGEEGIWTGGHLSVSWHQLLTHVLRTPTALCPLILVARSTGPCTAPLKSLTQKADKGSFRRLHDCENYSHSGAVSTCPCNRTCFVIELDSGSHNMRTANTILSKVSPSNYFDAMSAVFVPKA